MIRRAGQRETQMSEPDSFVQGNVFYGSTKEELARILKAAGIDVVVGPWKLTLFGSVGRFHLRYVGNIAPESPFSVDASGYGIPLGTVEDWCTRLASCLEAQAIAYDYGHLDAQQDVIREYKSQNSR